MPRSLRQPHRHGVARLLDAQPERRGTVEFLGVIFGLPDLAVLQADLDRRVHHHRGRRIAIVERRGIDEGLDRRARLPQSLHGPVELALGIGKAADQGQHAARMRVHCDERAINLRHLHEMEHMRALAGRRHRHDIALAPGYPPAS